MTPADRSPMGPVRMIGALKAKEITTRPEDTSLISLDKGPVSSIVTKRSRARMPKSKTGCRTCKYVETILYPFIYKICRIVTDVAEDTGEPNVTKLDQFV